MTNEEIGKLIGLSYSAVSRLRRGERLPSVGVMVAISDQLGWSVDEQVTTRVVGGADEYAKALNERLEAKIDNTVFDSRSTIV